MKMYGAIYTLFTEDFLTKALWENLTVSLLDFISMPSTNAICSTSDDYFFPCITKTHLSVLITLVFMIYNVAINVKICVLMYAFSFGFASTCALMSFMDWDCDLSFWNVGLVHTERERNISPFYSSALIKQIFSCFSQKRMSGKIWHATGGEMDSTFCPDLLKYHVVIAFTRSRGQWREIYILLKASLF